MKNHRFLLLAALVLGLLVPGSGEAAPPASEIPKAGKKYPMELRWDDRRPMVAVFVSRAEWRTPKNPSGFLSAEIDTTSEEGMKAFRQELVALADQVVATLRRVNGQGIIVWDIEGYEQPGMVYVGDPRLLPEYAPAMDKVADAFFSRIAEAGFRTGVCVRPNDIFLIPPASVPKWGKWGYRLYKEGQADPAAEIVSRMQYARKRWGSSLFYMDTNFYDRKVGDSYKDTLMTTEMIRRIRDETPESLLIPEHEEPGYFSASAPYNQIDMVGLTPEAIRKAFPGAFTVNMMTQYHMPIRWEEIVQGVGGGDVLLFGFDSRDLFEDAVAAAYREAVIRKDIQPIEADRALVALKSDSASKRLAALDALAARPDSQAVPSIIEVARHDPEWCLRRAAFGALAAADTPEANTFLRDFLKRESSSPLASHVALLVGKRNPQAISIFTEILKDSSDENREARYQTVFGLLQIDTPDVIEPLLVVTRDKYSRNRWWGMRILASKLKAHPSRAAFDQLLWQRVEEKNKGLKPQMDDALKAMVQAGIGTEAEITKTEISSNVFELWNDWLSRQADRSRPPPFMQDSALVALFKQADQELGYRSRQSPNSSGTRGFEETLSLTTKDDPAMRYAAVEAMRRSGDQRYAEPLARLLPVETDWVVQRKIIETLVLLRFTPGLSAIEEAGSRDKGMKVFSDEAVRELKK